MVEDQQKELDQWREANDMATKENWDDYWAAWTVQQSLDKEKEKRQEEEKIRHKRGS